MTESYYEQSWCNSPQSPAMSTREKGYLSPDKSHILASIAIPETKSRIYTELHSVHYSLAPQHTLNSNRRRVEQATRCSLTREGYERVTSDGDSSAIHPQSLPFLILMSPHFCAESEWFP